MNRTLLFSQICFIFLFFLTACNEAPPPPETEQPNPTSTPADTPTPFPSQTRSAETENPTPTIDPSIPTPIPAWFEGVYADIPAELASLQPAEAVSGQIDNNLPAGQRIPDHNRYLIDGWPVNDFGQQPQILAFPAQDYASINVLAQIEIDKLKQLLASEQILSTKSDFPFLPIQSQAKTFVAQPMRIPFQSGQGVRYLTWFPPNSAADPSSSSNLLYVWQGLTADGRGVVSAIFPIGVDSEFLAFSPPANSSLQSILEQWGEEIASELEQLPADAFTPSIEKLDQIATSIFANLPEPELIFDQNGKVDLTIVYPRNGGETLLGRTLEVKGYTQPGIEHEVELTIKSGGNDLAAQTVVSNIDGWWWATLIIPENVQGDVILTAAGNRQTDEVAISLLSDPTNTEHSTIEFLRPAAGENLISGYLAYLEGIYAGDLVDGTLTVNLLADNCQTLVAKETLTILPREDNWYSVLPIPSGLSGPACIIASTGTYGQPGWREAKIPVSLMASPPKSAQIHIGNPISRPLSPGSNVTIFGTAFSATASSLDITISQQDGSILNEGVALIDQNNLWEYTLDIPSTVSGRIFVEARLENGDGGNPASEIVTLPIQKP